MADNDPEHDMAGNRKAPEGRKNFYGIDPMTQPNEQEAVQRRRGAHAEYAQGSGDWDSFHATWDTTKTRPRER